MDVFAIPCQGRFIVYRPRLPLAFVANGAMVNLIAARKAGTTSTDEAISSEAISFLRRVGFFAADPPVEPESSGAAPFRPTVAVCLLTSACNFRCTYCYASAGEHAASALPVELGRRAIDVVCRNARESGESAFALSLHGGGEPTLELRAIQALVEHARTRSLPCKISLTSNGYWGRWQRKWILDHIDELSLSFDGNQELQDRQRPLTSGAGSFNRVMETITELDRRGFPYGIRVTATEGGLDQLPDAVRFICKNTMCRTIQIEPAFDAGRARRHQECIEDNERFADAFMIAFDVGVSHGRHVYYSGARPGTVTDRFCQALDKALIVVPEGGLTACYEVYGQGHPLADQFFFGRLSANGELAIDASVRARLHQKIDERRKLCRDCFCYWHCAGDCPPKAVTSDEDGHRSFGPRCDLNRSITRGLLLHHIAAGGGVWRGEHLSTPQ